MTSKYEKQKLMEGYEFIVGCDEVGRGCLAGPVVAAAVILPLDGKAKSYKEIKDSKLLSPPKREELSAIIKNIAVAWSIGQVSSEAVDEINIHNASLLAMKRAVEGLLCHCERTSSAISRSNLISGERLLRSDARPKPDAGIMAGPPACEACGRALARNDTYFLFVDGKFKIPHLGIHQQAIIGGDNKVLSVAAASIIAKVYRDSLMKQLDKQYPTYNFTQHKGYATEYHRAMIVKNGLSKVHRKSFCGHLMA